MHFPPSLSVPLTTLKINLSSIQNICINRNLLDKQMNKGVVSKETVVLRRWGSSIQKFGFINGVDNVNWPLYRDSKS